MNPRYDVLVIGGGLAGSAAAIRLAQAGRSVVLLEKTTGAHDKVCGEFLSGEATRYLHTLGIDLAALGGNPLTRVRLADHRVRAEAPLPFPAWSLSRRVLDEELLVRAQSTGVQVVRGSRITKLHRPADQSWEACSTGEHRWTSQHAVLATGKHDLHSWERAPGKQDNLIAFKMHWLLSPRAMHHLGDAVELIAFPGGYCGLQPIESGLANLALLVERKAFSTIGRTWERLLQHITASSTHLADRLTGARALWDTPLTVFRIPYGFVHSAAGDRLWRVGDQAAVIPSFSGNGMSIALHTAALASSALLGGQTPEIYGHRVQLDLAQQVSLATFLSRALVNSFTRKALLPGVSWRPGMLSTIASATRIAL